MAIVERAAGGGPAGGAGEVEVGMVAVETSTGDVLHAQFRCRALHAPGGSRPSAQVVGLRGSKEQFSILSVSMSVR